MSSGLGADGPVGDRLIASMRALSVESSFFLQAVADRLGMATTDFACLTLLLVEGPATAGRLAERTGLTTGAITGVIDRLERGGWARRASDPADRRRVIVEPCPERGADIGPVMAPMLAAARRLHHTLPLNHLEVVAAYVDAARQMLADQTSALRAGASGAQEWGDGGRDGVVAVPRGDADRGELRLVGFASQLLVAGADLGDTLCEVDLAGAAAAVHSDGGRVSVTPRRHRRPGRPGRGRITVNRALPWAVDISGGASRLVADLVDVEVRELNVAGGASQLDLRLPAPRGAVPIHIAGGASRIAVHRPAGVAVAVRVRGGASHVAVDGHHVRSLGGETRLEGDGDPSMGIYEVEIAGGASRVVIDSQ